MPLRVPPGGESGRTERRLLFNIGTSRHKQEALGYAAAGAGGQAPTLFEMQTGMVDRGASMACLSQSMVKVAVLAGPYLHGRHGLVRLHPKARGCSWHS